MKQVYLTTLLTLSIAMGASAAPLFQVESIFPPQDQHTHSSSIVECPNGDLLVCWFQGSGERQANDVVIMGARKKKGADAWSTPFLMADTPDLPDCNPVLFIDEAKRLWLFWAPVVANRWEDSLLKYRRAEEYQGEGPPNWSWQDVIVLKPGEAFPELIKKGFELLALEDGCWGEYAPPYEEMLVEAGMDKMKRQKGWMTRIHPTVLPGGRILLPLYSDGFNFSIVAISDDLGETWQASAPIIGYGPTQPTIVRKSDGTLMAYLRDEGKTPQRVQYALSNDDGETWTPARDMDIPNPSSSLEVLRLKDGRWAMLCNDTEQDRSRLVLILSDDEGKTWNEKRLVEPFDQDGTSFEYPSIIQNEEGLIHMSYTRVSSAGRTIAHCVINPEWLEQQK